MSSVGEGNEGSGSLVRAGSDPAEQSAVNADQQVSNDQESFAVVPQGDRRGTPLLALNGMAELQRKLNLGEFRGRKTLKERTKWREGQEAGEAQREEMPRVRCWYLPEDLCADCRQRKLCQVPGVQSLSKAELDLDLRADDLIVYRICNTCFDNQIDDGQPTELEEDKEFVADVARDLARKQVGSLVLREQPKLIDQYGQDIVTEHRREKWQESFTARMARIQHNIRAWIRNERLCGGNWQEIGGA